MKRKLICVWLSLTLILPLLALTGYAEETLCRIVDNGSILTAAEESALEEQTRLLRDTYAMDVVILTVDALNGTRAQDYAEDYYDANGYGCGKDASGVLLLIAMEEREWYVSTSGEAIYALTDYGIQCAGEELQAGFSTSYEAGFRRFLNVLPEFFEAYQTGAPIDGYADYRGDYYHSDREETVYYAEEFAPSIGVSVFAGLIIAAVSILIMRIGMNTKQPQRSAAGYMKNNSFRMHQQQDLFLYSNVTKVRREEHKPSGGGSSVHRSSGGTRHGGGGGKF